MRENRPRIGERQPGDNAACFGDAIRAITRRLLPSVAATATGSALSLGSSRVRRSVANRGSQSETTRRAILSLHRPACGPAPRHRISSRRQRGAASTPGAGLAALGSAAMRQRYGSTCAKSSFYGAGGSQQETDSCRPPAANCQAAALSKAEASIRRRRRRGHGSASFLQHPKRILIARRAHGHEALFGSTPASLRPGA